VVNLIVTDLHSEADKGSHSHPEENRRRKGRDNARFGGSNNYQTSQSSGSVAIWRLDARPGAFPSNVSSTVKYESQRDPPLSFAPHPWFYIG
jgi:hypothetical protein